MCIIFCSGIKLSNILFMISKKKNCAITYQNINIKIKGKIQMIKTKTLLQNLLFKILCKLGSCSSVQTPFVSSKSCIWHRESSHNLHAMQQYRHSINNTDAPSTAFAFMPSVGSSSQQPQNWLPALPGDRRFNAAILVLWTWTKKSY